MVEVRTIAQGTTIFKRLDWKEIELDSEKQGVFRESFISAVAKGTMVNPKQVTIVQLSGEHGVAVSYEVCVCTIQEAYAVSVNL